MIIILIIQNNIKMIYDWYSYQNIICWPVEIQADGFYWMVHSIIWVLQTEIQGDSKLFRQTYGVKFCSGNEHITHSKIIIIITNDLDLILLVLILQTFITNVITKSKSVAERSNSLELWIPRYGWDTGSKCSVSRQQYWTKHSRHKLIFYSWRNLWWRGICGVFIIMSGLHSVILLR